MKNYLVKSLFEVVDPKWSPDIDRSGENNIFPVYQEMHDLSILSHRVCLKDDWELVFYGGKTDNIHQALKETFFKIYDLWSSEPCNILYTDPDTLMITHTEIFGKFDYFSMFNITDPPVFQAPNRYNKSFDIFLNAGVRYFPASMKKETWDIGLAMAHDWDLSDWNTEQIILNTMAWHQQIPPAAMIRPALAYQAFMLPGGEHYADQWNRCAFSDANIIHWHSSRGAQQRLALMQQVAGQIGLL
jgi:hypothetical protein